MIPLSGRVPGRAYGLSLSWDDGGGGLQYRGKVFCPLEFSRQREFIGGRVMSGGGPRAHTTWWHSQGMAHATLWCGRLLVQLILSSGLRLPFR
jgi:hypothetical protein